MKTNIKIYVQGLNERAEDFTVRLQGICNKIAKEFPDSLVNVNLTSASDGRQTANIQYVTNVDVRQGEVIFNEFDLKMAYRNFGLKTDETEKLMDFLLAQTYK